MKANVLRSSFGNATHSTPVDLFTLTNAGGLVAKITNYGTIITELHVPDRTGKMSDVVLGFDNLEQYLKGHPYFGCTVGRVANRIAKGQFSLEDKVYRLAINNGPNHLHGGLKAFDKVVWHTEILPGAAVRFTHVSPDGDESYPGKLEVTVTMTLTDANELRIDYRAITDKSTPVNLTNHSYFNLADEEDVLGHELMLAADFYTLPDATSIPTGEIKSVQGTPLDFTTPEKIGSRIARMKGEKVGYDHNYVINGGGKSLALAARVYEPKTGRTMEVLTTQPGVQFYTGNYLDGSLTGKQGRIYGQYAGFCLETQHFPDAVNHPNFPSVILRPGETYRQTTLHKFSVR